MNDNASSVGRADARSTICYDDDSGNEQDVDRDSPSSANAKERSHTFRQRRLTCTMQHLKDATLGIEDPDASDSGSDNNDENDDESGICDLNIDSETTSSEVKMNETLDICISDKRKLTPGKEGDSIGEASKKQRTIAKETADKDSRDNGNNGSVCDRGVHISPSSKIQPQRKHGSTVLHASAPPKPSCPMRKANLLYHYPPRDTDLHGKAIMLTEDSGAASEFAAVGTRDCTKAGCLPPDPLEPEWKKSHQFHHSMKDGSLPFPRHVVGTYSCHGIEPVYTESDTGDYPNGQTLTAIAKINQDRGGVTVYTDYSRTALFGAYDGHGEGGELVSQYALHEIPKRLEQHEAFKNGDYDNAFSDVFVSVNKDLGDEKDIEPLYSGCTACVALVKENIVYFSNAGDSRAVLASRKQIDAHGDSLEYEVFDLTIDQNPDSPGEQERILQMGGFVSPPPEEGLSARVWLDAGFSQIGLAMARSLGDHAVKPIGVVAEPVVTKHELRDQDEFMIIATDGVWEFLSSQEAVDIVSKDLNSPEGSSLACQHLIEAAAAKWHQHEGDYRDDITAIVIKIKELWI